MKKTILSLICTLFLALQVQGLEQKKVYFWNKKEQIFFQIQKVQEVWVNELCAQAQAQCLALKTLHLAPHKGSLKNVQQGAYASAYCRLWQGAPLTINDEQSNEMEFCVFSDKTMIDAWTLYSQHRRKK